MPINIKNNLEVIGAWSSSTTYYVDNIVTLDGSSYVCILSHVNQTPPNATYWAVLAAKGDTGATWAAGNSPNAFTTIAVSGQSNVVADSTSDTLTLVAGSNITITTDAGTDAITIAASGGGGGGGVGGSTGSTDNALIRADGVGGATVQSSSVTLSDGGVLTIPKGTITASAPHTLSETWNSGGVTFIGTDIAVTDTASATASRVFRVSVGGTVIAAVSKTQLIAAAGSVTAGNAPGLSFEGFTDTGFGVNGDNLAIWESGTIALNLTTLNKEFRIPSDFVYAFSSATNNNSAADLILRRATTAVLQMGTDASTPVNQKFKAADGSGTNRPGANLTISAGQPTGSGTAGNLVFQVSTAGSSGATVQNAGDRMILSSVGEALKVMSAAAGVKGIAVKLAASPTEAAFEVRDSTETVLSSMNNRGMYIGPPTSTAGASARLPHGTAPTSPVNGDLWSTTSGFYGQVNGSTVGPFGAGGGGVSDGETLSTGFTFPVAGLHILDTDASHDLILSPGSNLTADRTLTLTTGDASRTVSIIGDGVVGETRVMTFGMNGTLTTGVKRRLTVPFNCTITGWRLTADAVGSIVIDVWKDTYANFPPVVGDTITGSEKPTLSSAQNNEDTTLTTWTTSVAAGDVLVFNIDSVSTITGFELSIFYRLT
jgi:hypothetical protein